MTLYRAEILAHVEEAIRRLPPDMKRGVREAIRAIARDPSGGEPLLEELSDYWKYRVRRFRVVYQVDRAARKVTIMAVGHRRAVYEELAASVRRPRGLTT